MQLFPRPPKSKSTFGDLIPKIIIPKASTTIIMISAPMKIQEDSIQTDEMCSICLDPVNNRLNCCVTKCGHSFHTSCLLRTKGTCPNCRSELTEPDPVPQAEQNPTLMQINWDVAIAEYRRTQPINWDVLVELYGTPTRSIHRRIMDSIVAHMSNVHILDNVHILQSTSTATQRPMRQIHGDDNTVSNIGGNFHRWAFRVGGAFRQWAFKHERILNCGWNFRRKWTFTKSNSIAFTAGMNAVQFFICYKLLRFFSK
jgi:hypothetical protein